MKRLLLLCAFFALIAIVVPATASAYCDVDCVRLVDGQTGEFIGYGCTGGENENCNPDESSCWVWLCLAPVALFDDAGSATMTLQFCPSVNDGKPLLTEILEAPSPETTLEVDDAPAASAPSKE